MKKPEPVPASLKCSACGLDWAKHPAKPTLGDCVTFLKAELARARKPVFTNEVRSTELKTPYWNFSA